MDDCITKDFLEDFEESCYPSDLLIDYEPLEYLSHNEMGDTILVQNRRTGEYFISKCYNKRVFLPHTTESELLKDLHHSGLPAFICEYQNETMLCVLREYAEGIPLDTIAKEKRLTCQETISIGVQLCNILSYLHGHTPPIIHRDIKPQNIIVDKEGSVKLIDFGISRIYNEEAKKDTICFGTMEFAPPEQYGFSQTDCRTDIFSLGVVLCWLITGETDTKSARNKIHHRYIRHVIKKCMAFAPEKRYTSAAKVMKALHRAELKLQGRSVKRLLFILSCCIFLCGGFVVGRYTDFNLPAIINTRVYFREPLIEQAAYEFLNKEEDIPLSEEDLLSVTELYVFGNQAAGSQEEFNLLGERWSQNDGTVFNGNIQSLRDLAKFKNLRKINIVLQNISDLSPLGNLEGLEQITLKHNPIEDISPLAALPYLRELSLYDTQISDFSVLSACTRLNSLDAGSTYITSMGAFVGIKCLTNLNLDGNVMETLSGIEELTRLKEIRLPSITDGTLSPLLSLPLLKKVYIPESMIEFRDMIEMDADFELIELGD